MKNLFKWLVGWGCLCTCLSFFSCRGGRTDDAFLKADSLNREAYEWRYKNLDVSEKAAEEALALGESYPSLKAEAFADVRVKNLEGIPQYFFLQELSLQCEYIYRLQQQLFQLYQDFRHLSNVEVRHGLCLVTFQSP